MKLYNGNIYGWWRQDLVPETISIYEYDDAYLEDNPSRNQFSYFSKEAKCVFFWGSKKWPKDKQMIAPTNKLYQTLSLCKQNLVIDLFTYMGTK